MLRFLKQYYPIRNIFFIIGEGSLIFVAIIVASILLIKDHGVIGHWDFFLKMLLIGFVCQVCLYYNDLYDLSIIQSYGELSIRRLGHSSCLHIYHHPRSHYRERHLCPQYRFHHPVYHSLAIRVQGGSGPWTFQSKNSSSRLK